MQIKIPTGALTSRTWKGPGLVAGPSTSTKKVLTTDKTGAIILPGEKTDATALER